MDRIFLYRPFKKFIAACFKLCCTSKEKGNVQYENPFRTDKFYTFMHKTAIEKEIKMIRLNLNNQCENEDFNGLYKTKLIRRKNDLTKFLEYVKQQDEEYQYKDKFISQFSYDLKHDEKFSDLLGVSEKMKEEIISQYNTRKSADQ
jgi:hypothetical protein